MEFSLYHKSAERHVCMRIDRAAQLNGPRFGVLTPDRLCETCGHGVDLCPGHAGWIALFKPVHIEHLGLDLDWIPVPPPCVRPTRMDDKGRSSPHDLTTLLQLLLRANNKKDEALLSSAVHSYYRGAAPTRNAATKRGLQVSSRNGRPLDALGPSLEKKSGILRGVCLGKRVNFSARVVITPDVSVRVDQVGLPVWLSKILTVPNPVTKANIQFCRVLLATEGAVVQVYKNASHVLYHVKWVLGDELEEGDVLHRCLRDGDVVLLNRQPTLWRSGIMAHTVVLKEQTSIGINPSVCKPYGADFDGDQMNVLVPQSQEAIAEARAKLGVALNLHSPRDGSLIVLPIQDTRTGAWIAAGGQPDQVALEGYPAEVIPHVLQEQQEQAAQFLKRYGLSFRLQDVAPDAKLVGLSAAELETASVPESGNLAAMVRSGAKAKASHCMQMRAQLGQQYLDGAPNGPSIGNSFWSGLNPQEFFLHSMSGREGSIDTAIKTATSGELYRALSFSLGDVFTDANGDAVLQDGRIVGYGFGKGGVAVGMRAAQALGEPATQMSLSNFHLAGTKQSSLLGGIARLKQLVYASKPKSVAVRVPREAVEALEARGGNCSTGEEVTGLKFTDVLKIAPGATCRDPWSVYAAWGIEAARECLYKELQAVWETAGIKVDACHLGLLADLMCCTGSLTGCTLNGLRARGADPLTCAAFEETAKQLVSFAERGAVDPLRSVVGCILSGKLLERGNGVSRAARSC